VEFFEVYCNPNGYGSAFEAKTLMTLRTQGGVKVSSEAKLAALQVGLRGKLNFEEALINLQGTY